MKKRILSFFMAALVACSFFSPAVKAEEPSTLKLYRLYNPNTGEHFYTGNRTERVQLYNAGWRDESIAWNTPVQGDPVYRLYNPNAGDHHYTTNSAEKDMLVSKGWRYESVIFNSAPKDKGIPVYREYNPNARKCNHNYTVSLGEHNQLISLGWRDEGIAFYASSLNEEVDLLYQSTLDRIVSAARTRLGSSYTQAASGRVGPNSFDCSGLIDWAYATAGVNRDMLNQRCWTDSMNTYLLGQVAHPTTNVTWAVISPNNGDNITFHTGDIVLFADSPENRSAGKFNHAALVSQIPTASDPSLCFIEALQGPGVVEDYGFIFPEFFSSIRIFRIIDI